MGNKVLTFHENFLFALPMYILDMHKWIFEANGYIFIITISNSYFWKQKRHKGSKYLLSVFATVANTYFW